MSSAAAVPAVGLRARSLSVYFGLGRFETAVIFKDAVLVPQSKLVVWSMSVMRSCPAAALVPSMMRLALPLTESLVIVGTVTVTV